jgi:hypothetical protein
MAPSTAASGSSPRPISQTVGAHPSVTVPKSGSSSAELAFFANVEQNFDVPENYRVQVASGNASWVDVDGPTYADAVANGITDVEWVEVETSKARLVFTPKAGTKVRLVEFKLF